MEAEAKAGASSFIRHSSFAIRHSSFFRRYLPIRIKMRAASAACAYSMFAF